MRRWVPAICLAAASLPAAARAEEPVRAPSTTTAAPPVDGPIRPPPLKDELPAPTHEKVRRLSLTASVVTLSMPASTTIEVTSGSETPSRVAYTPTVGLDVALRFPIFRYLEVGVGATFGMHGVAYDRDALGIAGTYEGDALARVQGEIRFYPTWPITDRVTLFAIVGGGFGRLEFPEVRVTGTTHTTTIPARGASFFDVPLGVGASLTLVPRWLSLELSVDVAPMAVKDGDVFAPVQVLEDGKKVHASALPTLDATYRQAVGLSLIL